MNDLRLSYPLLQVHALDALPVNDLNHHFVDLWWSCSTDLPELGPVYSLAEQAENEDRLGKALDAALFEVKFSPRTAAERRSAAARLYGQLVIIAEATGKVTRQEIAAVRAYGFQNALADFAHRARRFDPVLTLENLSQAARNAWSMNLFQLLFGLPMQISPAVFAYSLLYPYNDNYFDDPRIPAGEKAAFAARFNRYLQGEPIQAANASEERILALIDLIEDQYPRCRYPLVYQSLLAVHRAQNHSVCQLRGSASPYDVNVLSVSFEKGGTSVLGDGYLVAGELTLAQQEFLYFYGTLAQLIDDLEDTRADARSGMQTVFTQTARRWPLDTVTNRTFHYAGQFVQAMEAYIIPGLEPLHKGFTAGLPLLMTYLAACSWRHYTRPYRAYLQAHFPVRFSFLEQARKKLDHYRLQLDDLAEAYLKMKPD